MWSPGRGLVALDVFILSQLHIYVCGGSVNKVTVIDTPRIEGLKLAILGVIN